MKCTFNDKCLLIIILITASSALLSIILISIYIDDNNANKNDNDIDNDNDKQICNLTDIPIKKYKPINDKSDIAILFDVSGSMELPLNLINVEINNRRIDEFNDILEKISTRNNQLKNEKIRILSIIFGGRYKAIYDFGNILNSTNNAFNFKLTSKNVRPNENTDNYCEKFKQVLSNNGKRKLYLDNYIYSNTGPSERYFVKWDII